MPSHLVGKVCHSPRNGVRARGWGRRSGRTTAQTHIVSLGNFCATTITQGVLPLITATRSPLMDAAHPGAVKAPADGEPVSRSSGPPPGLLAPRLAMAEAGRCPCSAFGRAELGMMPIQIPQPHFPHHPREQVPGLPRRRAWERAGPADPPTASSRPCTLPAEPKHPEGL